MLAPAAANSYGQGSGHYAQEVTLDHLGLSNIICAKLHRHKRGNAVDNTAQRQLVILPVLLSTADMYNCSTRKELQSRECIGSSLKLIVRYLWYVQNSIFMHSTPIKGCQKADALMMDLHAAHLTELFFAAGSTQSIFLVDDEDFLHKRRDRCRSQHSRNRAPQDKNPCRK